jgi:hypothetical protein
MNGDYLISNANPKAPNLFNSDLSAGGSEHFDVYGPNITSMYSQVYWTMMGAVDLPEEIVKRFKGKVMAITGYEVDQVFKGAGEDGEDISVPLNFAYNHHYCGFLLGNGSRIQEITSADPRWADVDAHSKARGKAWLAVSDPTTSGMPRSARLTNANGGEYRKSWHGLPDGYGQFVESPLRFQQQVMQVESISFVNNTVSLLLMLSLLALDRHMESCKDEDRRTIRPRPSTSSEQPHWIDAACGGLCTDDGAGCDLLWAVGVSMHDTHHKDDGQWECCHATDFRSVHIKGDRGEGLLQRRHQADHAYLRTTAKEVAIVSAHVCSLHVSEWDLLEIKISFGATNQKVIACKLLRKLRYELKLCKLDLLGQQSLPTLLPAVYSGGCTDKAC